MTIATTTIRRTTADALPTLPGLAVECTAYRAPDNDGFAVVAFHRGAAIVLQITGSAAVQAALLAHIRDAQTDFPVTTLVIAPRASDLLAATIIEHTNGSN